MKEGEEAGSNTAARLVSLCQSAMFKPDFHPLLLQKTQLYKSSKWTFDLTMLDLIAILEVPQTYSRGHRRTLRTGPQSGADGVIHKRWTSAVN